MSFISFYMIHMCNLFTYVTLVGILQDGTVGYVEKWIKKEGESFNAEEVICEVTIDGVTLGIEQKEAGVLADILVAEDSEVPVGKTLAIVVNGREDYDSFVAKFKNLEDKSEQAAAGSVEHQITSTTEPSSSETVPVSAESPFVTLIKTVKSLVKTGAINEDDDFAHDLLSLCRHENKEILEAFDASYDGDHFNEATFEATFFINNARSIVAKHKLDAVKQIEDEDEDGAYAVCMRDDNLYVY